ncbi:hypothetical protein PHET_06602 [Paragonimus heterotremus]|uniref:Uncharacterized protein n=1 Tax=Paragonimus heterotremus TaxID=100268 RepID=A0A8J4SYQ8_9TREM|nr:hypothetical protein PHET_06602 [Paragonimus heterotremus]
MSTCSSWTRLAMLRSSLTVRPNRSQNVFENQSDPSKPSASRSDLSGSRGLQLFRWTAFNRGSLQILLLLRKASDKIVVGISASGERCPPVSLRCSTVGSKWNYKSVTSLWLSVL